MANRILVVEDDAAIAETIGVNLKYAGYDYLVFDDGSEAENYLREDHGFQLMPIMIGYNIPVIYMTAKTDSASQVRLLREGAEDYLVKPFEVVTLLVRIEKVLQRTGRASAVYRFFDMTLDTANRTLYKAGEEISLPPLEFDVLAVLVKNKNRTVSRDRILNEIWGEDYFGDIRTVDVRVANLRKKLGLTTQIRTISKTGYRLEEPRK